jgi:hypothetical protein
MRRPRRLLTRAVRYLTWLCLFLTLSPGFGIAANGPAPSSVPIVSKLSGAVSVLGKDGVSNDVISSRIIHSGDKLMTGVDSLALINLADVGSVRIGPASTATASVESDSLSVNISAGSACAQSLTRGVNVVAGSFSFTAADENSIFSIIQTSDTTTLAVYQGSVSMLVDAGGGSRPMTFKAGEAATSTGNTLTQVALSSVQPSFAALQCPDASTIAGVMPAPAASPASGGHGGGAGGILAALLGVGAIVAAAGGHGGGGNSAPPTTAPTSPPGTLGVNNSNLNFLVGGNSQTFTASETNYTGMINAVSNNTAIATVSPASGKGPSVQFTVTPVGAGSTTITVTDDHSGQQTVNVTVTPPGSIGVAPNNLTFLVSGAPQTFNASEADYTGPLTAVSNNQSVVTVAGSGNAPGPVTFTVTPVGAGTTTIVVHGGASPATVSITVIGPLQTDKSSLTFLGTTTSKSFTATDPFYTGVISAMSSNQNVATVATVGSANGPGPVQFSVTPVGSGNANITVSDTFGGSATVTISVSSGGLEINPTSLTFTVGGAQQTFQASEADYTGTIFAASSDPTLATVLPPSGGGPGPVTFTVNAVKAGNPTIAVTDDHGGSRFVDVTVTGPITVGPPSSLTFNGTTTPQTLSVSDPNYVGSISANSSNVGVATVDSPLTGPNATFSVTPVSEGTATITFADANLGSATANITVNPGPLNVSTQSVSLTGVGSSVPFTASETFYTGAIAAMSQNTGVATVAPASGPGPGPVTFTITAAGPGSTNVNVTDNHGGQQQVAVTVTETPTLVPHTFTFTDVGATNAQTATLSEPGYTGNFNDTDDTCGPMGIADITPASAPGPSTTITVTPRTNTASGGTCQFAYKDSFGNTTTLATVTVGPFGTVTLSTQSLTFTDVGSTNAQPFTASETNYTGALTIDASNCNNIATVAPPSGLSGATFTVTPVNGGGPCNVKVNDDHTQTATVSITVGPFGPITPSPTSFTFMDVGAQAAQPLTVSESGYTGLFTIDDTNCSGIATASPASSTGNFTVTPAAQGNCHLTLSDDHNSPTVQVQVAVGPFGPVMPSAGSVNLKVGGSSQSFMVSESGYDGNFTLTDSTCSASGASVLPLSGNSSTTFNVSPGANSGNCKIVITDDSGQIGNVDVFVTAGSLTLNPNELQFPANSSGTAMMFMASDSACGALDTITAVADGTVAASVSPTGPQPCTPGQTYTVTAGSNGQGFVNLTDTAGGAATLSVGVGVSPLRKKHHPLSIHKGLPPTAGIGSPHNPAKAVTTPTEPGLHSMLKVSVNNLTLASMTPSQPVMVSEIGYTHSFTITSSNADVATASAQTATGPTATIVITPHADGITTIRITDDHGGVQFILVWVRGSGPKGPRLRAP